uniref:Uncharacterized protein n=1 Tax=Heterorhabditis bacteriophora TaxID=37862 RepID=A0A1I7WAJ2_HETBA
MTIVEQLFIGRVWQQGVQRNGERLVVPEWNRSCAAFPTSQYLHRKAITSLGINNRGMIESEIFFFHQTLCRELRKLHWEEAQFDAES